jgi:hypothetical protein
MNAPRLLAVAIVFAATAVGAAQATDSGAAAAAARAAADAADNQLVDQRRAVWARLDATQKAAFARTERAWLNAGRTEEEGKCLASVPAPTRLAEQTCRLQVAEQHLAVLAAPIVQASVER